MDKGDGAKETVETLLENSGVTVHAKEKAALLARQLETLEMLRKIAEFLPKVSAMDDNEEVYELEKSRSDDGVIIPEFINDALSMVEGYQMPDFGPILPDHMCEQGALSKSESRLLRQIFPKLFLKYLFEEKMIFPEVLSEILSLEIRIPFAWRHSVDQNMIMAFTGIFDFLAHLSASESDLFVSAYQLFRYAAKDDLAAAKELLLVFQSSNHEAILYAETIAAAFNAGNVQRYITSSCIPEGFWY